MTRIIQDTTALVARYAIERWINGTQGPYNAGPGELQTALRDLTPTTPDEHQVTLAGGNGEPCKEFHCNLRDGHPGPHICSVKTCGVVGQINAEQGRTTPAPDAPRTEDYTLGELFPSHESWINISGGAWCCKECSALVNDSQAHVQWHNKLLP